MELSVRGDFKRATRYLTNVQRRQVPFATALALTRTAFDGREAAQEGMKSDLNAPTPFTLKGVQVRKATKRRPVSVVFIEEKRADYLRWAIFGGTRRPKRRVIIIGQGRRNRYGNTPGFRALRSRLLAKPHHFEGEINGQAGIWKRKGRDRRGLELVAAYVPAAEYRKRFRFHERVERIVDRRFSIQFAKAMRQAMRTAR